MLICPQFYIIDNIFIEGFKANGCEVFLHNYRNYNSVFFERFNSNKSKLPFKIRSKWEHFYLTIINKKHLEVFNQIRPDLVLVYNNEMLLPETVKLFKGSAKIFFFLGDNPYYSQSTNRYNLALLSQADQVLTPDTYWKMQLEQIGFTNIHFFASSLSDGSVAAGKISNEEKEKFGSDIIYIGRNYPHSWGYKRTLFLSKLSDLNLKIYGDKGWEQWIRMFPELNEKLVKSNGRLSHEKVKKIMTCSKIYPVDANPGILNGLHLRIFECIENEILPVVEFRKDIDLVFKGVEIPVIYNYNECRSIVLKYLENDTERIRIIKALKEYAGRYYSPGKSVANVLNLF